MDEHGPPSKGVIIPADFELVQTNHPFARGAMFGHTFGHAFENGLGYRAWLHGEVVAIRTCMAATMSYKMGWIDGDLVKRTYDIMLKAKCPVELPVDSPMNREMFLKAMSVDKKVANGQLRLILFEGGSWKLSLYWRL